MSILTLKSTLQQKIAQIEDVDLLAAIQLIIDNSIPKKKFIEEPFKRKFGCGKGIFTYVADDFDAPLEDK